MISVAPLRVTALPGHQKLRGSFCPQDTPCTLSVCTWESSIWGCKNWLQQRWSTVHTRSVFGEFTFAIECNRWKVLRETSNSLEGQTFTDNAGPMWRIFLLYEQGAISVKHALVGVMRELILPYFFGVTRHVQCPFHPLKTRFIQNLLDGGIIALF